jgi:hypothetical protein
MNARQVRPWMWILGIFVLLRVTSELDLNLLPLLVMGFVAYLVVGNRRRRPTVGPGRPGPAAPAPAPGDGGMPRIQVPRFPGGDPDAARRPPGQEPVDPWGRPAAPAGPGAGADRGSGMSSLGSDPVVSLAQLQVAQAGRDLEAAAATHDDLRLDQALRRLVPTLAQVQAPLATAGSPAAARVRASVDALRGAAQEALREPPGERRATLVGRIVSTARTIGQTGPHE